VPVLRTRVDPRSEVYAKNREVNLASVRKLQELLARARAGGGDKYVQRHVERGKLLPRQRVELLLDRDSPFLEIAPLAGCHEGGVVPGGSIVAGIGWVRGTACLVTASDATVQGGAINPSGLLRSHRLAEVGWENRLPEVHLIESAGADLPRQAELFVPGGGGFRHITRRSAAGLATVALVFGSCTAGGAYIPGMSDYVVMVENQAYMYLAGPPLVKMATGEVVDDEALGGASMHSRISGVSDWLAADEADCLRIGREIVGALGRDRAAITTGDPPLYDPDELLGIASADVRVPFDAREVIARLVDGSRFFEFKPLFGPTLVTGWAEIGGRRVGILANNGVLYSESAEKGAQFVQLCNQSSTPLLFLQNITGFMVGREAEASRQVRVQDVEAARAEAQLERLRVHDDVVSERDRPGEPGIRDARTTVDLEARETRMALANRGHPPPAQRQHAFAPCLSGASRRPRPDPVVTRRRLLPSAKLARPRLPRRR